MNNQNLIRWMPSAGVLVLLGLAGQGAAQPYTFVNIADSTGAFTSFSVPVINEARQIAFVGVIYLQSEGVYRGPDPVMDKIASSNDGYDAFGSVAINDLGVVAFDAIRANFGPPGIFTGPDPVGSSQVTNRTFAGIRTPTINNAGQIAFGAVYGPPHTINPFRERLGIYRAQNGVAETIVETTTNTPGTYFRARSPVINESGTIAFYGTLQESTPIGRVSGIYTGPDPASSVLIDTSGAYLGFSSLLDLNDLGQLAFMAIEDGALVDGIYRGPNPATDVVAKQGPYLSFLSLDLNNTGTVAFGASLPGTGQTGIFTGPSPTAHVVIRAGDPLFGGTVGQVYMTRGGLNDRGDIGFSYILTDGRSGVGIAQAGCGPDLTTGAVPGQPGYGVPNGVLGNDDFFYYLSQYAAGNLAIADLTTTAIAGSPGYGLPNGVLNSDDFFFYLTLFADGC